MPGGARRVPAHRAWALGLLALGPAWAAHGATYSELVDGDISGDRLAPTMLVLEAGVNPVRGAFGNGDVDYLAVSVPAGHELARIILDPATVPGSQFSFLAVQAGPVMTVSPAAAPAGLLGWTHFGAAQFGTDILDDMGRGLGAIRFTGPLPAGDYTFWTQELESGDGLGYAFDFEVTAVVPLPPAAALLAAALGSLGVLRARRREPVPRGARSG